MAIISLRAYHREIEEMLDNGHYDDAITHCRHILEHFPKNVETYRLMGKALLESQRFADASDIFQRVLACIPDDFVSHLGMSIIREDEGDVDEAIWHMERAFEAQPSNAAVQAELRRLYGKRDGLAPQKIQLTRGALARMSAKSTLYSQAIAELRTALAEDPERPDLLVALAEIYAKSGDELAAIDTCNLILNKLPYCYSANLLLARLLPGTDRSREAHVYQERLNEIDPYCAHLSENYQTPEQVPDTLVTLDRYEGEVGEEVYGPEIEPAWTSPIDEEKTAQVPSMEDLPEWLREFPSQTATEGSISEDVDMAEQSTTSATVPPENSEYHDQDDIPQWLKDNEWGSPFQPEKGSLETFDSSENIIGYHEEAPESTEITSPDNGESIVSKPTEIQLGAEASIPELATSVQETEIPQTAGTPELPESLAEGETQEITKEGEEIPDWLQDLGAGLPEVLEQRGSLETTENAPEEIPEFKESSQLEEDFSSEPPGDLPDWLEKVVPDSSKPDEEFVIARADIPIWLRQLEEEVLPEVSEQTEEKPLSDLFETDKQPIDTEGIPDWLVAAMSADTQDFLPYEKPIEIVQPEISVESDTQPVPIEMSQASIQDELTKPELRTTAEPSSPVLEHAEEIPEEAPSLSQEVGALSEEDEEAALAWLESLAARQGAIEEELLTPPEERLTEMPEWIQEEAASETEIFSMEVEGESEKLISEFENVTFGEMPPVGITEEDIEEKEEVREPFIWEPELGEVQAGLEESIEKATLETAEEISPAINFEEETPEGILVSEAAQAEEELPAWLRELETEAEPPAWEPPEGAVPSHELEHYEAVVEKIDINTASLGQLERIPGVGFILAQNIINYREFSGGFKSLAELANIPGLNADIIPDLEKYLTVEIVSEIAEPVTDIPDLRQAWKMLLEGNVEGAVDIYSDLIRRQEHLDDVIRDLQEAVSMYLSNATLYQTLGDAYVRANRLQDALTAYTRAEDLLA